MELSTIVSILRRRAALLLFALVMGPNILLALGLFSQESAAGLSILIARPSNDIADPDRFVQTQMGVLQSDELAKLIASKVPGSTATAIQTSIDVVQRPRTDVVDITITSDSSANAVQIGKALVTSFSEIREKIRLQGATASTTAIDARITQVLDDLDALAGIPVDETTTNAATRQAVLLQEYDALITRKTEVQFGAASRDAPVQVLDSPHALSRGGRPSVTSLLAAAIGGGVLGSFVVLGVAALGRPRVLSRPQAEEMLGRPVLAEIHHTRQLSDRPFFPVVATGAVPSAFERDFAHMSSLIIGRMKGERFTMLVTSSEERAGTSTIARALAASCEGTNASVLLVDANLENSQTTTLLGASGLPGLGRVLADQGKGVEFRFVREVQGHKILFLPADAESAPSGAVSYEATGRLVDGARSLADIVVFDGGIAASPAAVALAAHVDLIVVVVPIPSQICDRLRNLMISPTFDKNSIVPVINRP
jgi:Mrp family chromosome partitioning ATPase